MLICLQELSLVLRWLNVYYRVYFCTNKNGVLPCGECRNCCLIEAEDFSDVTVVRPINHIIKTERVRELVRNFSQSGFEQQTGFIICDAEKCMSIRLIHC